MTRRKAVPIVRPPVTWILVADSTQAQIYVRQITAKHSHFHDIIAIEPIPVPGMKWEAECANHEGISSNNEPESENRTQTQEHFPKRIGEHLNRAKAEKVFDHLVLIAPTKMLDEIRKHLQAKTLKCVVAEMPKDLTHYNSSILSGHFGDIA